MEKQRVLLAEDDFDFGSILKQYLEIHNFEVRWAHDGQEALEIFKEHTSIFDICVFDVMMPKMDGFMLAEKVLSIDSEIPFIFLTAKKMKDDRVKGLKLGADDYIIKPFEADILVLRLQNILKRVRRVQVSVKKATIFSIGVYLFDPVNHQLKLEDTIQRITDKESQLIQYLYRNKNELIKRDDLLINVWGNDDFFSGRSMDVFISRLRKYFKEDPSITIESTRGVGLTFKV
jgi:DNA-binding response OmpR family regulator